MKKLLLVFSLLGTLSSFASGVCEMEYISYDIENRFDKTLAFNPNMTVVESYKECVDVALTEISISNNYRNTNNKTISFSYTEDGHKTLGSITK